MKPRKKAIHLHAEEGKVRDMLLNIKDMAIQQQEINDWKERKGTR